MRKLLSITCAVLFLAAPAFGQDEYPSWEIPVAFSYDRADFSLVTEDMLGFQLDIDYNFNNRVGLASNLAAQAKKIGGVTLGTAQFLIGPRFTHRTDRTTLFYHAQVGSHGIVIDDGFTRTTDRGPGFAFGGGLDINANRTVAIRAVQFDYLPHKISGIWLYDTRLGFGVVFRFGY